MAWRKTFFEMHPFRVAPVNREAEYREERIYTLRLLRSLALTLVLLIVLFQAWKRMPQIQRPVALPKEEVYFAVEEVPVTRQGVRKPPPPRPVVPIPTEEPTVPEDLTIEETDLKPEASLAKLPDGDGLAAIVPPRPVAEVFPEYPEKERKRGVQGEVELAMLVDEHGVVQNVQVVRNTTGSKLCAQAAVKAAYQTRFLPARKKNQFVAVWIRKTYKFGLD